jgi:hypothetical protein
MRRSLIACSLTLGLTLFAVEAAAQRSPVPFVDRPLTLPEKTLRIDADFPAFRPGGGDAYFGFFAGAGFGVTDDLEVFGRVIPITFIPDKVRFQDPVIGATYRFLDGDTAQIGVGGRIQVPVDDGRFFIFNPRLPIQLKLGDSVRMDTGVNISVGAQTGGGDAAFALAGPGQFAPFFFQADPGIPARFSFQLVDQAWLGLNTGAGFLFTDAGGSGDDASFFLPLGFGGGGTIPIGNDMMMDIHGGFEFPYFLFTVEPGGDVLGSEYWIFDVGARFYLDL